MATINAYKMDGLGNDFIIIDRRSNPINLTKDKIIAQMISKIGPAVFIPAE